MWKLYAREQGIAFATTAGRLSESLTPEPKARLCRVTYVDYRTGSFAHVGNVLSPMTHKRRSFEHEKEVRILRWSSDEVHIRVPNHPLPELPETVEFPWNPDEVLTAVVVSPYESQSTFNEIESELRTRRSPLLVRLSWSDMRADPLF